MVLWVAWLGSYGCYICRHRFLFFSFCHHLPVTQNCPKRRETQYIYVSETNYFIIFVNTFTNRELYDSSCSWWCERMLIPVPPSNYNTRYCNVPGHSASQTIFPSNITKACPSSVLSLLVWKFINHWWRQAFWIWEMPSLRSLRIPTSIIDDETPLVTFNQLLFMLHLLIQYHGITR